MFSDNFWELFTETGDIRYYLLYRESDDGKSSNGKSDSGRMQSIKT
ncbi:MAG: YqzL family protein [Clostridiales bacterium]|nr:YqzL family protein [Clostridiales bacterium]